MRMFFAGITVVLLSLSQQASIAVGQQATMQFPVERDNSILGWDNHDGYGDPPEYDKTLETEEFSNHGGKLEIRARKSTQHAAIMDWDTDAINSFLAANADPNQPMAWTLNIFPVAGGPDDYTIETLESLNDWAEGNGGFEEIDGRGSFVNFNWDEGTKAATTNFAQTAYEIDEDGDPVLDLENSLPWVDDDLGTGGIDDNQYSVLARADHFVSGQRIPNFINSEFMLGLDTGDAAFDGTFASVPLDADLINAILTDPNNRGIILGPASGAGNDNWQIFSRESDGLGGEADQLPGPLASFLELTYTPGQALVGDFDGSGVLDLPDVNMLNAAIASGGNDPTFDLTGDNSVDQDDLRNWVKDQRVTWFGDADLNGEFNSGDLVIVFQAGKYEQNENATWNEGDWTGDLRFGSGDLVQAFQDGGYEAGPVAASAVPEPAGWMLLAVMFTLAILGRRSP